VAQAAAAERAEVESVVDAAVDADAPRDDAAGSEATDAAPKGDADAAGPSAVDSSAAERVRVATQF
jgi:hypothetical protein